MSNIHVSPVLRFAGFTDDWEQRKVGEMASFSKGSGYSKGDLKEEGTPIILYGRLYTKYETVISDVDTFVEEKKGSVYSKGGEVIVPASGETAEDISIASVVEKSGVLLGGDLNVITPSDNLDPAFLAISISNGKPHKDMARMAQGKSVVHLHNSDLTKIDLPYPSYEEQRRISSLFSDLDNLITLHQRRYDQILQTKTAMLQKMFPAPGKLVPEMRFAGFTDPWERCKLSEICDFEKGRGLSREDLAENGRTPCILYGQLFTDYGMVIEKVKSFTDANLDEVKFSEKGDILIPRCSTAPEGIGRASALLLDGVILGFDINILKIKNKSQYAPAFISLAINHHQKDLQSKVVGTMVRHLENKEIKDVTVEVPCNIEEQNRIYRMFANFDNLINLQQHNLNILRNLKKSMLQDMFP